MALKESVRAQLRFAQPPSEGVTGQKVERENNGLLRVCVNVKMHRSEPFSHLLGRSLKSNPLQNIDVFDPEDLTDQFKFDDRVLDTNVMNAVPYEDSDIYESRLLAKMLKFYYGKNFDLVPDIHNLGDVPNSEYAVIPKIGWNSAKEKLVVAAGKLGIFRIILAKYRIFDYLDDYNFFIVDLPRPRGTQQDQDKAYERQIQEWRAKLGMLASSSKSSLSFANVRDFTFDDFTFYLEDFEIPWAQAKALHLEGFSGVQPFQPLPPEVGNRFGYPESTTLVAGYWGWNNESELVPGTNGERKFFGSILRPVDIRYLLTEDKDIIEV